METRYISFLVLLFLLSYLVSTEGACQGTLGQIQNPFYTRNSSIYFTWNAPQNWEDCNKLEYEIQWFNNEDNTHLFTDTTTNTAYTYNFVADKLFCYIFKVVISAKYDNVVGQPYDTIVVGDNFTSITIDPVENLQIQILNNNVANVSWNIPSVFRACWAIYYQVQILRNGQLIDSWEGQDTSFNFDYQGANVCDSTLDVKVTARLRNFDTTTVTTSLTTGSC